MYPIELKNVSFVYGAGEPYEIRALDNINLKLGGSMMTGFMGHTGSGKSTLVQLLNGILKPTSGQVLLDGKDIWENPKKIRDVRFKVGVVMQYPEYQLFDETVRADIAFGPKNMGLSKDEIDERVTEAVRFSGLDESLLDKSPFELSGGQKRRAALAGVMAMRPEILVLDEPAAGLDPGGRREILGRIREYQRSSGTSVIIVSHSNRDVCRPCGHGRQLRRSIRTVQRAVFGGIGRAADHLCGRCAPPSRNRYRCRYLHSQICGIADYG